MSLRVPSSVRLGRTATEHVAVVAVAAVKVHDVGSMSVPRSSLVNRTIPAGAEAFPGDPSPTVTVQVVRGCSADVLDGEHETCTVAARRRTVTVADPLLAR